MGAGEQPGVAVAEVERAVAGEAVEVAAPLDIGHPRALARGEHHAQRVVVVGGVPLGELDVGRGRVLVTGDRLGHVAMMDPRPRTAKLLSDNLGDRLRGASITLRYVDAHDPAVRRRAAARPGGRGAAGRPSRPRGPGPDRVGQRRPGAARRGRAERARPAARCSRPRAVEAEIVRARRRAARGDRAEGGPGGRADRAALRPPRRPARNDHADWDSAPVRADRARRAALRPRRRRRQGRHHGARRRRCGRTATSCRSASRSSSRARRSSAPTRSTRCSASTASGWRPT